MNSILTSKGTHNYKKQANYVIGPNIKILAKIKETHGTALFNYNYFNASLLCPVEQIR